MIIGVFKREIATEKLKNESCESCGAPALYVTVTSSFFVLGLPWFPTGKSVDIQCGNCKKRNFLGGYPNQGTAFKVTEITKSAKHKWYSYTMLFFMGLGAILAIKNEFSKGEAPVTQSGSFIFREAAEENEQTPTIQEFVEAADMVTVEEVETYEENTVYDREIERLYDNYEELQNRTSLEPQHPAAQYLLTLLDPQTIGEDNKGCELEAYDQHNNLIMIVYMPKINISTQKAKEELLSRTAKALEKKFNYDDIYLAFYGFDTNLYALKVRSREWTSHSKIDRSLENKLQQFWD